jgi:hypothetical protein
MSKDIFKQMKDIKAKVEHLLIKFPNLKEDDSKLIATFYYYEAGEKEVLSNMSAYDFLQLFSKGRFTNSESIRRVRAKLQEENPALRGKNYENRKDSGNLGKSQIKNI